MFSGLDQQISAEVDGDSTFVKITVNSTTFVINSTIYEGMMLHQKEALQWLLRQHLNNHGSILADEMGLGKTFTAISLISCLKTTFRGLGAVLVVCPATVVS